MFLLAAWIDRNAKWLLAVIFILTLILIPGLRKVRIVSEPIEASFVNPNEIVQAVRNVKQAFGANTRVSIITVEAQGSRSVVDPPALELMQNLTNALKTVPSIRRDTIVSLFTLSDLEKDKDGGLNTVPLVKKIPKNYFDHERLLSRIESNDLVFGRLISKDYKTAMIVAIAYDEADLFVVHDEVAKAIAPLQKFQGYTVLMAGDNEVYYQLQSNISQDAKIFIIIGLLMIIVTFYFMFRTWKGVVLPLVATLIGIIWTMGLIGYYGEPISMLSAMLPVVLVVSGSAYAIHVFHFLTEEAAHRKSFRAGLRRIFKRMLFPLFLSMLTTFIGGITLLTFKLKMIQHFGVFTAIGSLITFVVSIVVIPCLYKILRRPIQDLENQIEKTVSFGVNSAMHVANTTIQMIPVAGPVTGAIAETVTHSMKGGIRGFISELKSAHLTQRFLKAVSRIVIKYPLPIVVGSVILVIVSMFQMRKLQIGFDNISMLPKGYTLKEVTYRIDKAFNGIQSFDLVVDAGETATVADPEFIKRVDTFAAEARKVGHITHVFSVVDILKKMHRELGNEAEQSQLPKSKDAIAQYLFLLNSSGSAASVQSLISADNRKMKMRLTTNVSDTRETEKIYFELKDLTQRHFGEAIRTDLGGGLVAMVGVIRYIVWGKIQNIFSSVLTLLLIFALIYRSMVRSLVSVITLPVGVFATFGLMATLGIRLDIITAIITSFAMGIGVDFSIHWLAALEAEYKKHQDLDVAIEKAIMGPGQVILYDAISTIIGFSALFFSQFASIHTFATLLCFNMFLLALGSITLVPAVVKILVPEFVTRHRRISQQPERRLQFAMKVAFNCVVFVVLFAGIIYTEAKASDTPSPDSLLKKSVQAVHAPNEESIYVMKLVDAGGSVSTRKMRVWFKSATESDAKLLIKFMEPADIRGTGFLTIAKKGAEADQWLYLPALKKSRRIKGGNADEPFLGSDFSMGDLSVDKKDGLDYKVTGSQACDGGECHVVEGVIPSGADKGSFNYSKKVYFIRKDNFMAVKAEFYNQAAQLEKVLTLVKMHQAGKRWLADTIEMKNLLTKHSTVLEIEKRDTARVQPDQFFTVNFLERN